MRGGLREGFGYDAGLRKFDAEAQVDDGVVGALVHACEHRVGEFGAREDVDLHHAPPICGGDLAFEEFEEGVIACDETEAVVEGIWVC